MFIVMKKMRFRRLLVRVLVCAFLPWTFLQSGECVEEPVAGLPKVVLVGDSIRLGYQSGVVTKLAGRAVVIGSQSNGGDSNNVLKNLGAWIVKEQPQVVHLNCGIHDTKQFKATGQFQVPPEKYEANLREIVTRIRTETKATVLFALITPILTERAAKTRAERDYALSGEAVGQYNAIARRVMNELNVPVDDLHSVFDDQPSRENAMNSDGVHFTAEGSQKLAETVAEFVGKYLPPAK